MHELWDIYEEENNEPFQKRRNKSKEISNSTQRYNNQDKQSRIEH